MLKTGNDMEFSNFYTEDSLKYLNAAYDDKHGITQKETDKVNEMIRLSRKGRKFSLLPREGDMVEYFPQNGDYFPQAHIETIKNGKATICLSSHAPFCYMENGKVCYNTDGGPWVQTPLSGLVPVGITARRFQTWGRKGRCKDGQVYFHTLVRSWTFHEPNPLYGEYTMKNWGKYLIEKLPDPEKKGEYAYRGDGFTLYSERELKELTDLLHGKVFNGLHRRSLLLWGYRMDWQSLTAEEWNTAEGQIRLSFLGNAPVKIQADHERHTLIIYKKSNS